MDSMLDVRAKELLYRTNDVRATVHISIQALEDHSGRLGSSRLIVIRLLQDISSKSERLPQRVQLPPIKDRKFVNTGSEASVWTGELGENRVVSREVNLPTIGDDWDSSEGRLVLKVCFRFYPRYMVPD